VRLANGKTTFFDYRETAPGKATRDMYIKPDGKLDEEASVIGYKSVAVPGTVAGLELALKTYGTMRLAKVMAPAIRLAEEGFPVSEKLAQELDEHKDGLQRFPVSRRIFLRNARAWQIGEILRQPELAATLKRIAKKGAKEFYEGKTAHMIAEDMAKSGGLVTREDLAGYTPKVREVLRAKYEVNGHEWEVLTSPPPSSGGVAIIEALNILKDVPTWLWGSIERCGSGDYGAAYDCEPRRRTAHYAFFGCRCPGKCGGQHIYLEQQLWLARYQYGGVSVER